MLDTSGFVAVSARVDRGREPLALGRRLRRQSPDAQAGLVYSCAGVRAAVGLRRQLQRGRAQGVRVVRRGPVPDAVEDVRGDVSGGPYRPIPQAGWGTHAEAHSAQPPCGDRKLRRGI